MEFVITFINKGAIALVTGLIAYKAAAQRDLKEGITPASSSAACPAR